MDGHEHTRLLGVQRWFQKVRAYGSKALLQLGLRAKGCFGLKVLRLFFAAGV